MLTGFDLIIIPSVETFTTDLHLLEVGFSGKMRTEQVQPLW